MTTYQSILDQNEVLKAIRPELLAFAQRLDDGAERMGEIASDLTGLQKTYAGSGDALAKAMETKASMKKGADVSREIVAAIDRIVNAPLPSWITAGRA